jgi:hypothetical protein
MHYPLRDACPGSVQKGNLDDLALVKTAMGGFVAVYASFLTKKPG